jgi:protein pelota
MRLLRALEVNEEGHTTVRLSVSTSEDLWHLFNFIHNDDHVVMRSKRKVAKETSTGTGSAEMRWVTLELEVERVEFQPEELEIKGVNKRECEHVRLGQHHSFKIRLDAPTELTVIKTSWDETYAQRLEEGCNQEGKADTAAIMMDYGLANVCLVTPSLVYTKQRIEVPIAKKQKSGGSSRDKSIDKFYELVLAAIAAHVNFETVKVVLLCSPGTVRDEFRQYMQSQCQHADAAPALRSILLNAAKFVLIKTSSGHKHALAEAMGDPHAMARMDATKCSTDVKVWQKFHDLMNNDPDRCCYTPQVVFAAHCQGAVDNLLVSDVLLRSPDALQRRFFMSLCQQVRDMNGSVNIFSSQHVTGEQLTKLGGIAATLRQPMPELEELAVDKDFMSKELAMEMIRTQSSSSSTS